MYLQTHYHFTEMLHCQIGISINFSCTPMYASHKSLSEHIYKSVVFIEVWKLLTIQIIISFSEALLIVTCVV